MRYTIFSIDDVSNIRALAKFTRHVDTLNAMNKLNGNVVQCIGSYKGVLEVSFIMRTDDYAKWVEPYGYTKEQESVLQVSACNKQYADLVFANGSRMNVGSLRDVTKEEALTQEAWTYRPDTNQYWITVEGNPDR